MLSQQTIETIQTTIPLLEEHGQAITDCFYADLFTEHPFLKNVFNMANQGQGDQSRALSDAVIAYAKNIDNVALLLPAVERIANKHASLGIQKQQYDVVGSTLLKAIQKVLTIPEDHPAITAWGEAYQVLADVFIQAEETIYQNNEEKDGGWAGFRDFYIEKIVQETPLVRSFYFRPVDLAKVPAFRGGQYVGVRVKPQNTEFQQIRQYSLSQYRSPESDTLRISVKAEESGLVSNFLHHSQPGDLVQLQAPTGVFTLANSTKKHLFIAGGVGITPLMSMLEEAIATGGNKDSLMFVQCSRDETQEIFGDALQALAQQGHCVHKRGLEDSSAGDHQGYLTIETVQAWLDENDFNVSNSQVYFCGPKPFMKALNDIFLTIGYDDSDIHYEVFGPTTAL